MADLLYRWPASAHFGRRVSKEKFFEHGVAGPGVRQRIVSEVQRITWAYKLAESTVRLSGTSAVSEIQVFTLEAKAEDISDVGLNAIDLAVQFPIIFEIIRQTGDHREVRMTAAHKQLGGGMPKLSAYYSTGWMPADAPRQPLPTAISLDALYSAVLQPLLPVGIRPGEQLSETAARLEHVRKLEREVASLERKLRAERQFNRKLEIRRTLKATQRELEQER